MSTDPAAGPQAAPPPFDLDAPWQLHPQVSVRPERFGALLYHFGTRRLSFLKHPALLTVLESLASQPTARAASRRPASPPVSCRLTAPPSRPWRARG